MRCSLKSVNTVSNHGMVSWHQTFVLCRTYIILAGFVLLQACASDTVQDRRHGQQVIWHDGVKTLTVSNADSFVHLNHGDTVGPCPTTD